MKRSLALMLAGASAFTASAASAQDSDRSTHFDGPYVGVVGGYVNQSNDGAEVVLFDTNRDGTYGDTVRTTAGANAFSPGFCNGAAQAVTNNDCRNDKDDFEYHVRAGYDRRMGNIVVGGVFEFGRSEARDAVTAFSTTPANYTFLRQNEYNAGARLRAGYTPNGGVLFYATGGLAYARLKNDLITSNGANSFTDNGNTNGWGFSAGGGAEAMITDRISLGLEYLYTDVEDDDYVVEIGQGTAPATNPFLLNGGGTNMIRSDEHFRTHAIRASLNYRF